MKASKPNGNIIGGNAASARPFVGLSGMNSILRCGKSPRWQLYARKVEAPDFFKLKLAPGSLPFCSLWINFGSKGAGFNLDRRRAAEPRPSPGQCAWATLDRAGPWPDRATRPTPRTPAVEVCRGALRRGPPGLQARLGGLASRQEGIELHSCWKASARSQPRALESSHRRGRARAVRCGSSLSDHQSEGAVKSIASAGGIRHADRERRHMAAGIAFAPKIPFPSLRHADVLWSQRKHVAEPLSIGIAWRELAQRWGAKDGIVGELENPAKRLAGT